VEVARWEAPVPGIAYTCSHFLSRGLFRRRQRWVTTHEHVGPDGKPRRVSARTLRRWLALYRLGQFQALQPAPRRDRGQPRTVPETLLQQHIIITF